MGFVANVLWQVIDRAMEHEAVRLRAELDRAIESNQFYSKHVESQSAECDRLLATRNTLQKELADTKESAVLTRQRLKDDIVCLEAELSKQKHRVKRLLVRRREPKQSRRGKNRSVKAR
jgi:hypothetical protein